jgi:aspartyl/asparaginyl-tRNA synthetase
LAYLNLHEKLQQASRLLKEAQDAVIQAQGQDLQTLEQAENALNQAESELRSVQNQAGTEATENPQFQQAFESLHDIRQQVQEAQQNINDVL